MLAHVNCEVDVDPGGHWCCALMMCYEMVGAKTSFGLVPEWHTTHFYHVTMCEWHNDIWWYIGMSHLMCTWHHTMGVAFLSPGGVTCRFHNSV